MSEKLSEKATINDCEVQIKELNNLLASRTEECERMKQSENDLRTALRQVRDVISSHTTAENYGSSVRSAVQIIESVLHSASKKSSDSTSYSASLFQPTKQNRPFLSPRLKKHIELMHSSDSEYSDDDRDDDAYEDSVSTSLMADLALIAKGKIPPSLRSLDTLESAPTLNIDQNPLQPISLKESTKQSAKHISADPNLVKTEKYSSNKQMYQSVFDRLGSPSQFTGTQKDKFLDRRDRSTEDMIVPERDPNSIFFLDSIQIPDSRISNAIDRADYAKQNVFDRLQKTITQAAAIRQSETLHVDSRPNNDIKSIEVGFSSQDGNVHRNNQDENKRSPIEDDNLVEVKHSGESRSVVDRAAYTKQNVFDRLQKTTTLAAAVRQSETLHLDSRGSTDYKQLISPLSADSETLSVKKSDGKRSSSANKLESNDSSSLNVFDRLNKTTTRAFAKKANRTTQNEL
jgi:hypothetical protein